MKIITFFLLISCNAFAGLRNAPPSFNNDNKKAVFVDFKNAQYHIRYNVRRAKGYVTSTIQFFMPEGGYPLFDSLETPTFISLNNKKTSQKLISVPGDTSKMRIVLSYLPKGMATLKIKTRLKNGTRFSREKGGWYNVSSLFSIRDLKDRMLLEKYVPTNYEYDQYKMDFDVKVEGTTRWHSLFSNGEITKISNNHYRVSMPEWYSSSSVFFHLVPITRFIRWYLKYPSISGKQIPVVIYSNYRFYNYYTKKKAWKVLAELENDYGPYPHDKLTIYATGIRGGMEHAGAVETSIVSLGHELQHMYFAKGIHPANGNSGWLDEAIASWRDNGHQSLEAPFYDSANLGNHNIYTRKTDKRSYEYGRSFMAYINHTLKEMGRGDLKKFLRFYFDRRKYTHVTTEDFKSDLEEYAQMTFDEDFSRYIYGESGGGNLNKTQTKNIHHPELTKKELDSLI